MSVSRTEGIVPAWTVQDRLRKAREQAGLEQGALADAIGIGRATVGNYERGVTPPKRPILLSWALVTGVPLTWLERGDPRPSPPPSTPGQQPAG